MFVTVSKFRPARLNNFKWGNPAPMSTVFAALVVALLHMHFSGAQPGLRAEKTSFAVLLSISQSRGAVLRRYWCPHCQQQKNVEASVDRMPYIG